MVIHFYKQAIRHQNQSIFEALLMLTIIKNFNLLSGVANKFV